MLYVVVFVFKYYYAEESLLFLPCVCGNLAFVLVRVKEDF
jgi:hypothetical protein